MKGDGSTEGGEQKDQTFSFLCVPRLLLFLLFCLLFFFLGLSTPFMMLLLLTRGRTIILQYPSWKRFSYIETQKGILGHACKVSSLGLLSISLSPRHSWKLLNRLSNSSFLFLQFGFLSMMIFFFFFLFLLQGKVKDEGNKSRVQKIEQTECGLFWTFQSLCTPGVVCVS